MRGPDLVPALNQAYKLRSRSVHSLDELPEHVTALNELADTTWAPTYGVMFTLQGLARLARHAYATWLQELRAALTSRSTGGLLSRAAWR